MLYEATFPSFLVSVQRSTMPSRERTAAQAASANNRIHKVSSVVCFMFVVGPASRSPPPRHPRTPNASSAPFDATPRTPPSSWKGANDVYRSWFFISVVGFVTVHFSPIALDPLDWLLIYSVPQIFWFSVWQMLSRARLFLFRSTFCVTCGSHQPSRLHWGILQYVSITIGKYGKQKRDVKHDKIDTQDMFKIHGSSFYTFSGVDLKHINRHINIC